MDDTISTLNRSAASDGLINDFKAIGEATSMDGGSKYSQAPVMVWLAKFISGSSGGAHKDTPIFELCHLICAIDALGHSGDQNRINFFGGPHKALPQNYRSAIDDALSHSGWARSGFERTENGLAIYYDDDVFEIRFGRMPFLGALYEFLYALDDWDLHLEFEEILSELVGNSLSLKSLKSASNNLSQRLRSYRRKHLNSSQYEEIFDRIKKFLHTQQNDDHWLVDDLTVLNFWLKNSWVREYRTYKTIFNGFIKFMHAYDEATLKQSIENASIIGTDYEAQEIDPDDGADGLDGLGDWVSPLNVLDSEPADRIKFFKKEGERMPIEALMEFGPYAAKLPRAFMQLEIFGAIQSAITTDLQFKRGKNIVLERLNCDDAMSYPDKHKQLSGILEHVRQLQKATYFVLASQNNSDLEDNVVGLGVGNSQNLFEAAREDDFPNDIDEGDRAAILFDAENAFSRLTRKGFDDSILDNAEGLEGFTIGAGALLNVSDQLTTFLARINEIDHHEYTLADKFIDDKQTFKDHFAVLYGDVQ